MYKKVSYEEIGQNIGKIASKHFGCKYSDNIKDYEKDIRTEYIDTYCEDNGEVIEHNNCYVELSEVGKIPLIIGWNEYLYFASVEHYEYMNYYTYEYSMLIEESEEE